MAAALRSADAVLPVSRSLAALAALLGVDADHVCVVENGIDTAVFRPGDRSDARARLGLPADSSLLVGVGHFLPAKGYAEAIEALAVLAATWPSLCLVLIGAGPEGDALRALAESRGVADRVLWPGVQQHQRVADYLRAADVFVHPSHSEGRPNAVLEAQACGIPVVATDVGGTSEIVEGGVTGHLVAPHDPAALAHAVDLVLRDPPNACAIVAHAGARTWDDTARALVSAYRDALARRRAVAGVP